MTEVFHDDEHKLKYSRVPSEGIRAAARAFQYGAGKYDIDAPRNWERAAMDGKWTWCQLFDSAQRHLVDAWAEGEDIDAESGLHHIDHALANLMMLKTMITYGYGEDDRSGMALDTLEALKIHTTGLGDLNPSFVKIRNPTFLDGANIELAGFEEGDIGDCADF